MAMRFAWMCDHARTIERELTQLDAVRLAALREIAVHVGAIPDSHIEAGRLEHAFVLKAHRILAVGVGLRTGINTSSANVDPKIDLTAYIVQTALSFTYYSGSRMDCAEEMVRSAGITADEIRQHAGEHAQRLIALLPPNK